MNKIFPINAILFDMDGVLVDSEPLWDEAEKESLASYDIDYKELYQKYNLTTNGLRIDQVVNLFCYLMPEKNINPQNMINHMVKLLIEKISVAKPMLPGVNEALSLCRELGLKVGLASSSPMKVIDAITDCLNITDQFDIRVSAEKLDYGKPHPAVYLLAAEKIGESAFNCVTIEDSQAGMIATKAAQMTSIVIPAKHDFHKPQWCLADYKLSSLHELNSSYFK